MKIINPATEQVVGEPTDDNNDSVARKMEATRASQPAWARVPLSRRTDILRKFSSLIERDIESLSATLTSEVGKPLQQSRNEVNGARARIAWLTENAEKYLSDEVMTSANGLEERIVYEPLGVICNISAWNYPYLVGVNVFVPALLAGNAVMYKPSEYATLTGLRIQGLLTEAGIPATIFSVVVGTANAGEMLLDLPLDGYFFTGSYKTGDHIYQKVSSKMVPCQCELGGKDPLYVADDITDVKAVAAATADGAFYNSGQSCCSVERIYVHKNVFDNYLREFVNEVRGYKVGQPTNEGVYIGPLTRQRQLGVLEEQVADAVRKGARLLAGGKRLSGTGFFFEPTVLVDVTHEMDVMREESFGPIIGIMQVEDDQQASRLMADTHYGLTASVYSSDRARAMKILSEVNAGTGYWNCCDRVSAAVPWSGRKRSGFGSTLSHAGLRAFTRPKALHLRG